MSWIAKRRALLWSDSDPCAVVAADTLASLRARIQAPTPGLAWGLTVANVLGTVLTVSSKLEISRCRAVMNVIRWGLPESVFHTEYFDF